MPSVAFVQPVGVPTSNYNGSETAICSRSSRWAGNTLFGLRSTTTPSSRKRAKPFPTAQASGQNSVSEDAENETGPDVKLTAEEQEVADLIEEMDVKTLRWSEIPFTNIEEELTAIDEYVMEEKLEDTDPWPKFLRGAAYEFWGQPQLALAQYSKVKHAGGLRRVPELWERRAYNSFKIGNVGASNTYFDIGLSLYYESVGNELHFVHWFYENFKDYVPKRNGPPAPLQRGICKYCIDAPRQGRESLVAQIPLRNFAMDHAMLWLLASSVRSSKDMLAFPSDLKVVNDELEKDFDWDPKLALFLKLYLAAAEGRFGDVSEIESELSDYVKQGMGDDITTNVYMALYHDAFTNDTAERDRSLDIVAAAGAPSSPNDVENFLFYAAKNRLSAPPGSKNVEVPERAR